MAISLFHGSPEDYVQIVCLQDRYHERLLSMGWRKSPEELEIKTVAVGAESHEMNIIGLVDKDSVESYIKDNFGVDIDKRGSLETVKDKALAVINESGRTD